MGLLDRTFDTLGDKHLHGIGSETRLLQAALSLLVDKGQNGGLQGLMEHFQQAGFGNTISSWIGSGENVPITPEQVQEALGDGHLQQVAEEACLTQDETARRLSELLPTLVDKLTPAGHVPRGGLGELSDLLDHFLGR